MKRLRIINWTLRIIIVLSGIGFLIGWLVDGVTWHKPLSYLATIALAFAPDILRLFKIRPSEQLITAYELFMIVAMILGIDFDWYAFVMVTPDGNSYFDKIVHGLSGVLVAFVAKEMYDSQHQSRSKTPHKTWFEVTFLVGVVMLFAVGWECYEFLYDQIFGGHMQELVQHGVADTMWDLIAALVCGTLTAIPLSLSGHSAPRAS